jgi:hypothetical protein
MTDGLVLGLCVVAAWLNVQAGHQPGTRERLTVALVAVLVALAAVLISVASIVNR